MAGAPDVVLLRLQSVLNAAVRLVFSASKYDHTMGAGTGGGAGWASAHPGKNQGGHGPPWKF